MKPGFWRKELNLRKSLCLAAGLALSAALASASGISYVCAPGVAASTCNYLNTTVAGLYSSTFTNANADIYVQYGATGLASTSSVTNYETYASFVAALAANTNKSALQVSALASLGTYAAGPYGSGDVGISTALGAALGFTGLNGVNAAGTSACAFGTAGCYNASITVTNDPSTPLFYRTGTETASEYDFYSALEHETDEVLGTASCISTNSTPLSDGCGAGTPSAVDLFRYSSAGKLVLDSSLSTAPGAYFSYNGGVMNGADGNIYNTLDNGDDYADFVSNCPGGPLSVQDAEGCPGTSGLDITNDGGAEINILNAVGYDLNPHAVTGVPEPSALFLLGAGFSALGWYRLRRRA
jgi:hypothetical protein